MQALVDSLRAEVQATGFVAMGITHPHAIAAAGRRLQDWLAAGYHGSMGWMWERAEWRSNPAALWPEARSIIMLADSYAPTIDPRAVLSQPDRAAISAYAQGKDYHDLVKKRLKRVARWLIEAARPTAVSVKVFVDTAPVMEKPLAQAAGLGWQGKHSNLVSRQIGNWFFLGAIFTTLELPINAPEADHCGQCRRCLDACPTGAFPRPYVVDARRCISYLTIEHKEAIPPDLRPLMGNRIYGCDDCLAVCPWNKFAVAAREIGYQPRADAPLLAELAALDEAAFRARYAGSPIKRIGRDRFLRNVAIAIGNSGDAALRPAAARLADDTSPLVAEHGHWALARLADVN